MLYHTQVILTQYSAPQHLHKADLLSGKLHHHPMLLLQHGTNLKACEA